VTSGSSPTFDGTNFTGIPNGAMDETYINADGTVSLSANWDIGDGYRIEADEIRARDGAGLKLYEDGGNGIFVEDGGQVGIGTTEPSAPLHVVGSNPSVMTVERDGVDSDIIYGTQRLKVTKDSNMSDGFGGVFLFAIEDDAGGDDIAYIGAERDGADDSGKLIFNVSKNGAFGYGMVIDKDGNVGIGTTEPGNKLDIVTDTTTNSALHIGEADNEGGYFTSTTDNQLLISSGSEYSSGSWYARSTESSQISLTNGEIYFKTDDSLTDGNTFSPSQRMVIDTSGNVGIGTTEPDYKFHIKSPSTNTRVLFIEQSSADQQLFKVVENLDGDGALSIYDTNETENIRIASDSDSWLNGGNVGIGTTEPDTRLDVNGAVTRRELSADPSDPDEGSHVIWQSDGTGSGNDGDIMMKITAGGNTKTTTLVDFSAI
jgi:hypothetical protein